MKKKNNKQFIKIIIFAILFVLLTPLIVNFIVETSNFWGFNFINNSGFSFNLIIDFDISYA